MMIASKTRHTMRKIISLLLMILFTLSSAPLTYADDCHSSNNNSKTSGYQSSHSHKMHSDSTPDGKAVSTDAKADEVLKPLSDKPSVHAGHCLSCCTLPTNLKFGEMKVYHEVSLALQSRCLHSTYSVEVRPPKLFI